MEGSDEDAKLLEELNDQKIKEYALAIAYSVLVMILGIGGNIFSIAYYGFRSQKTTTNNLITALAITDLITCIVFCDEIIELCFTITFKNVTGCKFMYFTNHTLVIGSAFILVLICVDRFRKICRRQLWQLSVTSAKVCVGLVLFLSFLLSVRDFFILDVVQVNLTVPEQNKTITGYYCTHSRDANLKAAVSAFQFIDLATFLTVIPTMVILYSFVAREIWVQRKMKECHIIQASERSTDNESEKTGTKGFSSLSVVETASSALEEDADQKLKNPDSKTNPPQSTSNKISMTEEKGFMSDYKKAGHLKDTVASEQNKDKQHHEHHSKRKQSDAVERKIAVMMIVITAASILSFVPYFIVNLAVKRNSNKPEQEFSVGIQIALRSFMLNNAVNPYIMGFFNTQFKQFVKDTVCKCRYIRRKF